MRAALLLRARYYDPVIGRFISPDSIVQSPGDPQTLNRYSYCRNNPQRYTDPSGNFFLFDDLIEVFVAWGLSHTAATAVVAIAGGAALGASTSAISGGNPLKGAIVGAISGALFSGPDRR